MLENHSTFGAMETRKKPMFADYTTNLMTSYSKLHGRKWCSSSSRVLFRLQSTRRSFSERAMDSDIEREGLLEAILSPWEGWILRLQSLLIWEKPRWTVVWLCLIHLIFWWVSHVSSLSYLLFKHNHICILML